MDTERTITFPRGLFGFEEHRRFRIYHDGPGSAVGYWLQSEQNEHIAFPLVNPKSFGMNYSFKLSDAEQELLQCDSPEEIEVFLVLGKGEEGEAAKPGVQANIAAPIIINTAKRLGLQKILHGLDVTMTVEES